MFLIGLRILRDVFPGADLPQTPDSSSKRMEVINFLVGTTIATVEPDVGMYRNHIQAEISKLRADKNDQNPTVSRFCKSALPTHRFGMLRNWYSRAAYERKPVSKRSIPHAILLGRMRKGRHLKVSSKLAEAVDRVLSP